MADFLGPLLSTNFPNKAAEPPPSTIIKVKAKVTDETVQPMVSVRGMVYTL